MENLRVGDRVVSNYHGVNGQVVGIASRSQLGMTLIQRSSSHRRLFLLISQTGVVWGVRKYHHAHILGARFCPRKLEPERTRPKGPTVIQLIEARERLGV